MVDGRLVVRAWFGPRGLRGLFLVSDSLCRFFCFECVREAEEVCGTELDGKLSVVVVGGEWLWVV